jgi:hypothetical protein
MPPDLARRCRAANDLARRASLGLANAARRRHSAKTPAAAQPFFHRFNSESIDSPGSAATIADFGGPFEPFGGRGAPSGYAEGVEVAATL